MRRLLSGLLSGWTTCVVLAAATGAAADGPPLETPAAERDRAVRCPVAFSGVHEPILLVHGTAGRPEDHWALGYQKILPDLGFDVCTVRLPALALNDIQVATEYVVHAVRIMTAASGKRVDIVGYSQGGLEPRWAVKYWLDVSAAVDDIVTLASPHHGAASADGACAGGSCEAAIWQMNQGSNFIASLNTADETPGAIDYTSIYSLNDELVQPVAPTPTAALDGATNILVQDVCAGRPVAHGAQPVDAAVFALALDALTNPGPGDPSRIDPAVCNETYLPGLTEDDGVLAQQVVYANGGEAVALEGEEVEEEPPLKWYALPEPSLAAGLVAAVVGLATLWRRRRSRTARSCGA
jgi:MYXO-CTERM domain-containing protein